MRPLRSAQTPRAEGFFCDAGLFCRLSVASYPVCFQAALEATGKTFGESLVYPTLESSTPSTAWMVDVRPQPQATSFPARMVSPEQSELFTGFLQSLLSAVDAKDHYTAGHSNRVARVSVCLARQMGLSPAERDTLYLAGLLHDIGKIGIDDQVLNKPGRLTTEEFDQIKQHPQLGCDILQSVKQLDCVLPAVLHHHEAWDGSGYPHGLEGTDIPQMARILAVADAWDAMSSARPYRRQVLSESKIDTILHQGAGRQWDPKVIDAFFAIQQEIRREASGSGVAILSPSGKHEVHGPRNTRT